jgi:hypothetical protein
MLIADILTSFNTSNPEIARKSGSIKLGKVFMLRVLGWELEAQAQEDSE